MHEVDESVLIFYNGNSVAYKTKWVCEGVESVEVHLVNDAAVAVNL